MAEGQWRRAASQPTARKPAWEVISKAVATPGRQAQRHPFTPLNTSSPGQILRQSPETLLGAERLGVRRDFGTFQGPPGDSKPTFSSSCFWVGSERPFLFPWVKEAFAPGDGGCLVQVPATGSEGETSALLSSSLREMTI